MGIKTSPEISKVIGLPNKNWSIDDQFLLTGKTRLGKFLNGVANHDYNCKIKRND
jgi:hypothetical protein